jgi:hypothetical protein
VLVWLTKRPLRRSAKVLLPKVGEQKMPPFGTLNLDGSLLPPKKPYRYERSGQRKVLVKIGVPNRLPETAINE